MKMFCRQCEQTAGGKACTLAGVCGKTAEAAVLMDLLIHGLKGLGFYGKMLGEMDIHDKEIDRFVLEGLFTTVTNVNFDPSRLGQMIYQCLEYRKKAEGIFQENYRKREGKDFTGQLPEAAFWQPAGSESGLLQQWEKISIPASGREENVQSLQELFLYGLKGMAAYTDHSLLLGLEDKAVTSFFYKGLAAVAEEKLDLAGWLEMNMELGQVNLKCMELLDKAHRQHFGIPAPTKVSLGVVKGPAIVISGHDLLDLEQLLSQAEKRNVNVYTHGEMLPAHGYPGLKKHKNLVGHYGTAWQNQQKEFSEFPGAILMTTNCLQKPRDSYQDRIFTTGLVGWPGVKHIVSDKGKKDFSPVIEKALEVRGFAEDRPGKELLVGFGHEAVSGMADKIIEAIKSGKIRHLFLIGGCDGARPGRSYYQEFARLVPEDCLILTLACGKYRFHTLEFGQVEKIPRLLDCGQCNDSYSAIKIAVELANAFGCDVNHLPLSLILSWYEQKAVAILLTLLSLGIKNIRIGPTLPAFISPGVLEVLKEKFNLKPITSAEKDLQEILAKAEK